MKYRVRAIQATGGYIDSIRWMDRVCFPGDGSLVFDGAYWWMAFDEDQVPAGYASVTYYPNGAAFLSRVGVLPGHRGHGLQKRFIRAREHAAKAEGLSRAITYTARHNIHSSNNMIRCGYNLYLPPYEYGTAGCLYWEKKL